jgi:hypothetical protein
MVGAGRKANPCSGRPPVHTLGLVSLKIVFNGQEYEGVDAMPPDVRKEYERALANLRESGGEEILSILQRGGETDIKATVREFVVNGKKYDSVEAMPPEVRRAYERAMGGAGLGPTTRPRTLHAPVVEVHEAGEGRTPLWRIVMWMAAGALVAWWLFRRG